ncbi:MAG: glycosyltransferase family 9 protein [Patescibacteria group bacterium]|nr:glycosyltransferase family 9 protein [Patescibacteria group bacterium]
MTITFQLNHGIGDNLFITPTLKLLREYDSQMRININTIHPQVFLNNPYVSKMNNRLHGYWPQYADPISRKKPDRHHIVAMKELVENHFNLKLSNVELKPEIFIKTKDIVPTNPVGVQTIHKNQWFGNKVWKGFNKLAEKYSPIPKCKDIENLVAVLKSFKLIVCAEGCLSHLCKALDIPCIVIYGGFAIPEWNGYEDQINIISNNCKLAPCYKPDRCPFDKKCFKEITTEKVDNEIKSRLWN